MTENYDDTDNSAVAIPVNVLMKLEQLILEPFKVQIFWTQKQKDYSKATTTVLNLMYTQKREKKKFLFLKSRRKWKIRTCQSLSVVL